MLGSLKKRIFNILFKNYTHVPSSPVDIRKLSNDPRLLNYTGRGTILLDANVEDGRFFQIMPLGLKENPFISALKKSESVRGTEQKKEIITQVIQGYYEANQPESACDWFNLSQSDAPELQQTEPWAAPMPWSDSSVPSMRKNMVRWLHKDHKKAGVELHINHGFTYYGPVTEKKLTIETDRLLKIYQSIHKFQFNRSDSHDGDIIGTAFISKTGEWRWNVSSGHHQSIALAALGYDSVPLRVKRLVYENEASYWPNVLSGLYSKEGALKLFNTIFHGSTGHLVI